MNNRLIVTLGMILPLFLGFTFYAFYNDWIVVRIPLFPIQKTMPIQPTAVEKRAITFFIPSTPNFKQETSEIIWSTAPTEAIKTVTQTWLALLDEEGFFEKKVTLQSVAEEGDTRHFYLSFDRPPFSGESTTAAKLLIIESLLATLRSTTETIKTISFFCHHQPVEDYHLDFSRAWPIEGFLQNSHDFPDGKPQKIPNGYYTIMIDPAGDARNTGRIIGETFERGITLQFAEHLKELLEHEFPNIRIILTRFPGEKIEPLQNANFVNRLGAQLYVSLNFAAAERGVPHCAIYYFLYNQQIPSLNPHLLSWHPYQEAYINELPRSRTFAQIVRNKLLEYQRQGLFQIPEIRGIPFKPLIGIRSPSIACEIGLHSQDDWALYVKPVAAGLAHVVRYAQGLIS
ncbi:MAG: N-acetylmuramoyl-L-alanine amidase [Candidatus Babeliaceae bacterium]|nr:N-acetylmuramoyl-L-alanine amidase [Candidatus Babeliaceae bacterium]